MPPTVAQTLHWRKNRAAIETLWIHVVGAICEGVITYPSGRSEDGAIGLGVGFWPLVNDNRPSRAKRKEPTHVTQA